MDFGDLIILLFFVLPVLSRILSKKKKKKQPQVPATEDGATTESLFQRAIREIESALQEADGNKSQAPTPEPRQPEVVIAEPPRRRVSRTKVVRQDQFHEQEPGSFESKQFTEFHELRPVEFDKSLYSAFDAVRTKTNSSRSRVRTKLMDKRFARDSFLLSEIFGKPHSLKRPYLNGRRVD